MKEQVFEMLSFQDKAFKVPTLVYESELEADTAAGHKGAMLAEANKNLAYRGSHPKGRRIITEIVQEFTGIKFNMVTVEVEKDGKKVKEQVRDPKDTDAVYVKRALATNPALFDSVQTEVYKRCRGYKTKDAEGKELIIPALAVDIKESERVPKVLKLAQKYKDIALAFIKGERSLSKFNAAAK